MTRCPSCGSSKTQQSFHNRNEFACGDCDSVFNPVMERVYTEGNYKKFCGSVASLITENMSDASVGSSIREIIEGYVNEDPKDVNLLVERLTDIAYDLYNDYKMNRRDKYDFGALLEGINRLNEFANIQSPQENNPEETMAGADPSVEMTNGEVPEVDGLPDPMSMLSKTDGPIEVGEHSALEDLKNAICAVQCAIAGLESAESQETSASEINVDPGIAAIPTDDSVVEGLQSGALDTPTMGNPSDPAVSSLEVPPTEIAPAGNEGPEHEADEQGAIAQLKSSLAQLQDAYAKYMGSEKEVHPEQGGMTPSTDFTDKLNALTGLDSGVDSQTYLEKVKELMEDAQLVNQDWMKKDLANSIAVNTQEIGEDAVLGSSPLAVEARAGENDIPTQTFVKKPAPPVVAPVAENDPVIPPAKIPDHVGTPSGEITDQPGEVDPMGPIHTDDVVQGFSPENFFKTEDNVLFENKQHVVIAVDGRHITIRNPRNGHTVEVMSEDVEYANSEDSDIRSERFEESNSSLLSAWEKIEKTMNNENLNAPKRTYDLRTNNPTEGL